MKIPNPLSTIGKLITGTGSETLANAAQKIDERDILKGLIEDVMDTISDKYRVTATFEVQKKV